MRSTLTKIVFILILILFEDGFALLNERIDVGLSGVNQGLPELGDSPKNDKHGVIKRSQRSPVNIHLADIARFVDKSPAGKNYSVNVDDTMRRLIFKVATSGEAPMINVTAPSGRAVSNQNATIQSGLNGMNITILEIPLTNRSDFGKWNFFRLDSKQWDVTVQGQSPVYIKHEFFEVDSNKTVNDKLIANKHYRLVMTVYGIDQIQLVEQGRMFSKYRLILQKMVTIKKIDNNKFEATNTSILSEIFYVGIQGKDNSNNTIVRIDPTEIKPVLFLLDVSPKTGTYMCENSTMNVTFMITSYMRANTKVSINDTMGLVQGSKTVSFYLKPDQNVTGTFLLEAGTVKGTTSVTIIIRYRQLRNYVDGPEVQRKFTVVSNDTNLSQTSKNTVPSPKTTPTADGSTLSMKSDSTKSDVPIGAVAGGIIGAILVLVTVVIGVIVYKKLTAKKRTVEHGENTDMPRKTKYSNEAN